MPPFLSAGVRSVSRVSLEAEVAPDSRQIVRRLVQLIQAEHLTAGDRLPSIRTLSARLGVSSSVIRDAMMQAEAIGLIRLAPRSGAFVQKFDYRSIIDMLSDSLPTMMAAEDHNLLYLLEARSVIELECAAQAALRRRLEDLLPLRRAYEEMMACEAAGDMDGYVEHDIQFHLAVSAAGGNPVLTIQLQSILQCLRPFLRGLPWSADRRVATEHSHADLYEAILKSDEEGARAAMLEHLGLARDHLVVEVQSPLKVG
jgi:DNA-binding FadR family transcriptional regulator